MVWIKMVILSILAFSDTLWKPYFILVFLLTELNVFMFLFKNHYNDFFLWKIQRKINSQAFKKMIFYFIHLFNPVKKTSWD